MAGAETVDRVVAAVGNRAITASDLEAEYKLELLLDAKDPDGRNPDANTLARVRDRLIDQDLLEQEAVADGVDVRPDDPAVDDRYKALLAKVASLGRLKSDLSHVGLSQDVLRRRLAREERILRVIDERLRPLAAVEPGEIESYYKQILAPELGRQGQQPAPPISEVESRIREILIQQKIDALLADWLKTLRSTHDVHVYDAAAEDNRW